VTRTTVDHFCHAVHTDRPGLPCVERPHLDGSHRDVHGNAWATIPVYDPAPPAPDRAELSDKAVYLAVRTALAEGLADLLADGLSGHSRHQRGTTPMRCSGRMWRPR
jgi:hypothetical protein